MNQVTVGRLLPGLSCPNLRIRRNGQLSDSTHPTLISVTFDTPIIPCPGALRTAAALRPWVELAARWLDVAREGCHMTADDVELLEIEFSVGQGWLIGQMVVERLGRRGHVANGDPCRHRECATV